MSDAENKLAAEGALVSIVCIILYLYLYSIITHCLLCQGLFYYCVVFFCVFLLVEGWSLEVAVFSISLFIISIYTLTIFFFFPTFRSCCLLLLMGLGFQVGMYGS